MATDTRTTPLEEESTDLDAALNLGHGVFDPEAQPPDVGEEDSAGGMVGHPATQVTEPTEPEEQPEGTTEPVVPVSPVSPPETPVAPAIDPQAERSRLESERRMNQATQEAAELRTKQAQLEAEVADLKKQATTGPDTKKGEDRRKLARQELRTKLQELSSSVKTDQPDYWDRLTDGWADGFDPIMRAVANEVVEQYGGAAQGVTDEVITKITESVWTRIEAKREEQRVGDLIVEKTKQAGLEVFGRDQEDFWDLVIPRIDRTMPQATAEEKLDEAIRVMERLRGSSVIEPVTPATPPPPVPTQPIQTPRAVTIRQPMGRAGTGRTGPVTRETEPQESQESSLDDALNRTHGTRRG